MRHEGICLAIYSLEGKLGDENYMKMLSVNHNFNPVDIYGFGSTLWEDEDIGGMVDTVCDAAESAWNGLEKGGKTATNWFK